MIDKQLILLTAGLVSLLLSGCAASGRTSGSHAWQNFREQPVITEVGKEDAALVFYRDAFDKNSRNTNIIINGEYHASLQPGAFTQLTVCALPQRVGAFFTGTDSRYLRKAHEGSMIHPIKGQATYIRLTTGADGEPVMKVVHPDTAVGEIDRRKYQNHGLSRVNKAKTCIDRTPKAIVKPIAPPSPKPLPKKRTYILDASALFKFNQSDASNIKQEGRNQIEAIARDIREYPLTVHAVEVIGHTDPLGSSVYNRRLSAARAKTVGQILVQSGVDGQLIKTLGVGSDQLLVADCAKKHKRDREALKRCNQPNRRVEIKLHAPNQ